MLKDRAEAARRLADILAPLRGSRPLVLAIPRGAVPMGRAIAEALGGELDVALVHKLGAPGQPELAIGAVDEDGRVVLGPYAEVLAVGEAYVQAEAAAQLDRLRRQRAAFTPGRASVDPAGRVVVVLDDGIATGATMLAALEAVRARGPKRLIACAAVAPAETVERLEESADEVVVLFAPEDFGAVSVWFEEFPQVDDAEVVAALRGPAGASGDAPGR
jgi:predicted phosphoribosyltransferase